MGVSLGPILWRCLSSIVALPPSSYPSFSSPTMGDAKQRAHSSRGEQQQCIALCLLPSHHGCLTRPCGRALLTRHE